MSNVAITRCESYDQSQVDAAVKTVCHAALMPPVAGKRVLIKPNILSDAKEEKYSPRMWGALNSNPSHSGNNWRRIWF